MAGIGVKYTYQDLRSTPDDGKRYELFEGDLIVSPSPATDHQGTVLNAATILRTHVIANQRGRVFIGPCDVYFDEETVVVPDLFFVAEDRLSIVKEDFIEEAPDLSIDPYGLQSGGRVQEG